MQENGNLGVRSPVTRSRSAANRLQRVVPGEAAQRASTLEIDHQEELNFLARIRAHFRSIVRNRSLSRHRYLRVSPAATSARAMARAMVSEPRSLKWIGSSPAYRSLPTTPKLSV